MFCDRHRIDVGMIVGRVSRHYTKPSETVPYSVRRRTLPPLYIDFKGRHSPCGKGATPPLTCISASRNDTAILCCHFSASSGPFWTLIGVLASTRLNRNSRPAVSNGCAQRPNIFKKTDCRRAVWFFRGRCRPSNIDIRYLTDILIKYPC